MNLNFAKILGLIVVFFMMVFFGYAIYLQKNDDVVSIKTAIDKRNLIVNDESSFTFILGGDAMLGRAVAWKFDNDVTQAFEKLGQNYFANKNLGLINLEGPISTENITPNPTADNLVFNFPLNSIAALKYLGVNAVSLGNNHSQNQGQTGLDATRTLLTEAGITPIGAQTTFNENSIKEFKGNNINLSVITINELANQDDLMSVIKAEKTKGNLVLVFPHWGNEYQTTHSGNQTELGHSWIDSGADLVIGSHPHVVQDAEVYKNKPIFYSLGNFVFDQNFSSETQHGLILSGTITDKNISLELLPTVISGYQVELQTGAEKDKIINQFKKEIGTQYFQGDNLEIKNE